MQPYYPLVATDASQETHHMYFRRRFSSFEEFQRESFDYGDREFGKDEIELLEELESSDEFYKPRRRADRD
jgi:hypothetical protein